MKLYIILVCIAVAQGQQNSKPRGRIVGGIRAKIQEHPYIASIRKNGTHFCGGAVISLRHVLTAAHCLKDIYDVPNSATIVVGTSSSKPHDDDIIYTVRAMVYHQDYNEDSTENDIAVLMINGQFQITKFVQIIPIVTPTQEVPVGTMTNVVGYGETQTDSSKELREVDLPIVDHEQCEQVYWKIQRRITKKMICTGFPEGGKDSCQGDSGGPLMYNNMVLGVVSFGYGCGIAGYPGVYTDVRHYVHWINFIVDSIISL